MSLLHPLRVQPRHENQKRPHVPDGGTSCILTSSDIQNGLQDNLSAYTSQRTMIPNRSSRWSPWDTDCRPNFLPKRRGGILEHYACHAKARSLR